MAGLTQDGIKSCKYHLKRILSTHNITFSNFNNILCQIEALLNSRPLSAFSTGDNIESLAPLTPVHFLCGQPISSLPSPSLDSVKENRLTLFQRMTKNLQSFWRRWKGEYLNDLVGRSKW